MVGPAAKREAVTHLKAVMGLSERRACQIISADRKTIRYRSSRPPEADLRAKLRDLANERRRFGYRRLFILLRRDGEPSGVNRKASAAARRGECQAEADRRRLVAGQGHAAGCAVKKALRPARKRRLVDAVKADWKVSIRRACSVFKIDRSLYVYQSRRGEQAELKLKVKEICQTRVRYGYRRVHVLIRRDGWAVNPKGIYRLYTEMGLQLRNKTPKRRVKAKLRADRTEPAHSNNV
jgi:transposase InsO family protein